MGIGNDERFVVFEHRSKTITGGACTTRIIKGKERRREHGRRATAGGAGGMLRKTAPISVVERQRDPFTFAERRRNGIGKAAAIRLDGINAIDNDQHVLAGAYALFGLVLVQPHELAVDLRPNEPGSPELSSDLYIGTVCGSG